jgi:hypothetical protein
VTDKNFPDFLEDGNRPFLILFESRYDTGAAVMIEAFQTALERLEPEVIGGVCMVEEAPELSHRLNVHGVPTVVAGMGDSVLGETLGSRTADQLASLIKSWLLRGRNKKGTQLSRTQIGNTY